MTIKPRWWWWLLLAPLFLVLALLTVRHLGFIALEKCDEDLRAHGLATTLEEWLATAPPIDAVRQERMRDLIGTRVPFAGVYPRLPSLTDTPARLHKDMTTATTWADANRSVAERFLPVLAEGPVVMSLWGFCPRDAGVLRTMTMDELAALPFPNLLSQRSLTTWIIIEALRAENPEPRLVQLDQWWAAHDHPGSIMDAMITIAIGRLRDDALLWLATRGRLTPDRLAAWTQETNRSRAWLADGLQSERILWMSSLRHPSHVTKAFSTDIYGPRTWTSPLLAVADVGLRGYDLCQMITKLGQGETLLRGLTPVSDRPMPFGLPGVLSQSLLANIPECLITALENEHQRRVIRLAGWIAAWHHTHGALPTEADLPPGLLAGSATTVRLAYEAFPPHRFRVAPHPSDLHPAWIPADRWANPTGPAMIGTPPGTNAEYSNSWAREIDLGAVDELLTF